MLQSVHVRIRQALSEVKTGNPSFKHAKGLRPLSSHCCSPLSSDGLVRREVQCGKNSPITDEVGKR